MEQIKLYIKESYNELVHKVTWPSWQDLQQSTVLVIIGTLILAAILFVMDLFSNGVTDFIYQLG
ncbi:MAG: preprotein translocase subunit SecE [Saprospiraceae bacterium]|nr:preprotein translocase subunit SecE [Saprospiraceae bacterium]NRB53044.1 preprotein translocase subunit SecE [Saprospiraceae bacterium]